MNKRSYRFLIENNGGGNGTSSEKRIDRIFHLLVALNVKELNFKEFMEKLPYDTTVEDMLSATQILKQRGLI